MVQRSIVGLVFIFLLFTSIIFWLALGGERKFTPIFSGLSKSQISQVSDFLTQNHIPFESAGGEISVDASIKSEVLLLLSNNGLPGESPLGYERLDALKRFGVSSKVFNAAFWRAKEGELEKTILGSRKVKTVRVHLSNGLGKKSHSEIYGASIYVVPFANAITDVDASSFRKLVASSVSGLKYEDVVLIDGITGKSFSGPLDPIGETENRLANNLESRLENLLLGVFSPNQFEIELSVAAVRNTSVLRENRIDPNSQSVLRSERFTNSSDENSNGNSGVTVASNVPDGANENSGGVSSSRNSEENVEAVDYDYTRSSIEKTQEEVEIAHLSVGILIDSRAFEDLDEASVQENLKKLEDTLSAAVGLVADRGDSMIIQVLPFNGVNSVSTQGLNLSGRWYEAFGVGDILRFAIFILSVSMVYFLALKPFLKPDLSQPSTSIGDQSEHAVSDELTDLSPESEIQDILPVLPTFEISGPDTLPEEDHLMLSTDGDNFNEENSVSRLRDTLRSRESDAVEIIREWMQ